MGGREAKSYDREKAWPSTNHSILSGRKIGEIGIDWKERKREKRSEGRE